MVEVANEMEVMLLHSHIDMDGTHPDANETI